jgi:superfamily II DNA/RNA helicase
MFEMGFEAQVRSICDHVRPGKPLYYVYHPFSQNWTPSCNLKMLYLLIFLDRQRDLQLFCYELLIFCSENKWFFVGLCHFPEYRPHAILIFLDRQIMLFSATFKKRIERLARDSLVDPVKIVQVSVRLG